MSDQSGWQQGPAHPQGGWPQGGASSQGPSGQGAHAYPGGPQSAPSASPGPQQGYGQQWSGQPGHSGQQFGQQQSYGQPGQQFAQQQPHVQPSQQFGHQPYGQPGMAPTSAGSLGRILGGVILGAVLLAIIGCFGTWAKAQVLGYKMSINGFGSVTSNIPGTNEGGADTGHDGVFVLVLALVAAAGGVALLLRKFWRPGAIVSAVAGLLVVVIGLIDLVDINDKLGDMGPEASSLGAEGGAGWGLWLVILSGIVMLATGIVGALRGNK